MSYLLRKMNLNWQLQNLSKVFYIFFHLSIHIFVYLMFHIRPKTLKISSDGMDETKILIIEFVKMMTSFWRKEP